MKTPTFFAPQLSDHAIILSEEEVHHAFKVLRLKPGDPCFVVNAHGEKIEGRLLKTGEVEVMKRLRMGRPFGELSWMVPFLAPEELKDIVQAATILGVSHVYLTQTGLTQSSRRDHEKILDKLKKVVVAAQKVASIPFQPELREITFEEMLGYAKGSVIVFHQDADQIHVPKWAGVPLLCFGPEGGFTPEEIRRFEQQKAVVMSLGPINYPATLAPVIATMSCKPGA